MAGTRQAPVLPARPIEPRLRADPANPVAASPHALEQPAAGREPFADDMGKDRAKDRTGNHVGEIVLAD
jgi:hypothetical protein